MTDLGDGHKLRAAFELSPTILTVTELETGRVVEVNDAFLRVTGYAREEIIGRTIPEVGCMWAAPSTFWLWTHGDFGPRMPQKSREESIPSLAAAGRAVGVTCLIGISVGALAGACQA